MSVAQVAADLRAAAEVLRRDGWTQGAYQDGSGRCCLSGALRHVIDLRESGRYVDACRAVWDQLGGAVWNLPAWNDAPGRTADEVIAALEAAADAAEAQS